ncbi:MAG: hypothetical protein GTN82_32985, partial [Candidatus Aminicenantes bacterium]|nr:hypothetical protein [Candidatus Aminicenantes bacterium]NIN22672.1 hypothetical protein [Candidatus Aminicenantes bacterium]NIN46432.1 hypothetical protein [Candidatus Aminicenantes bacterium]NIR10263.1 hypothetical protein [Candidatus Aminicenantes bacterium]
MKINQTRLAKEGFELIINGLYRSDNTIAEDALLNWTELCTKQGWITVNDLNSLPDKNKWSSPAIKELRN